MKEKLLIIGKVWPEPKSSAAGSRMMQLIRFFIMDYEIHFATGAKQTDYNESLEEIGIKCREITLNNNSFDTYLNELQPAIVMFDRFNIEEYYGWRVMEQLPDAIRILNTEDLHFLREARKQNLNSDEALNETKISSDSMLRELAAIHRCDMSIIISEKEIELLESHYSVPSYNLVYLPLIAPQNSNKIKKREEREGFVFIGNFWHEPNWDAVLYLKKDVWPRIRKKLPKAKLNIYGAYPSEKVFNLNNLNEGFIIHGRAENAVEVVSNALISLVPLRFGAGIKGKIIESWSCGTPCVSTRVGAEDMSFDGLFGGSISENIEEFIEMAVELYENEKTWKLAQKSGFEVNEKRFSYDSSFSVFKKKLIEIINNYKLNREEDVTAQLMRHHSHLSTKYLSKWIEEKNKS